MSLLVPPRRPSSERLDDPDLPVQEMLRSLDDLRLVHRRWGGSRALQRHVAARAHALGCKAARILDVGAGSGDVARDLERNLRASGVPSRVVALDLQWRHLAAGRARSLAGACAAVAADAFRLPVADRAVDLVVSTLFFHHFSPDENVSILREFARVSRRGFAVFDLTRHRLPALFVALAGRLVFQARISVEDGVASVRQAYTPEEALAVSRAVAPGSRVRRVFPFRYLLTAES